MTKNCPQCGKPVPINKPGFVQCPNCMTTIAVPAEDFLGPSGDHIDDVALPRPPKIPIDALPAVESSDVDDFPICEICTDDVEPPRTPKIPADALPAGEASDAPGAGDFPVSEIGAGDAAPPRAPKIPPYDIPASGASDASGAKGSPVCEICRRNPAVRACASCGKLTCDPCSRPGGAGLPICADCASRNAKSGAGFESVTTDTFFSKFFETIKQVALKPAEFFESLPVPGKLWPAVIFGVAIDLPGAILQLFANMLLQPQIMKFVSQTFNLPAEAQSFSFTMGIASFFLGLIFIPVGSFIAIFVSGAITHLILLILGGVQGGFEDTIRATGYAKTTSLAKLVPGIGSLVAYVWGIVVLSIGLSRIHKIPTWKAVVALLIPALICCCGIIVAFSFAFTAIMALLGNG